MISADNLASYQDDFAASPINRLMQNAVTESPIKKVAMDRTIAVGIDKTVSHRLDDWKATNQKKSGRCWLFSGLNSLRYAAATQLNVKDFEFSQNWMLFWDKLEKSNYFLESMIDLADADADDRTVHHLLSDPIGDGGQWNMFVALVKKYGVVPKSAMPETESSSCTASLNETLQTLLRQGAHDLRDLIAETGRAVGEQAWAMPLLEEQEDELKSPIADIRNTHNARTGGMLFAGLYLSRFVPENVEWAHIDIAGPAWNGGGAWGYTPKRATGAPVRTILEALNRLAAK